MNQLGQIKISNKFQFILKRKKIDRTKNSNLGDFGVSSQLESSLSKCKTWVGTVLYMSVNDIIMNLIIFIKFIYPFFLKK